jgi:type IV pilus assembly protein PilA
MSVFNGVIECLVMRSVGFFFRRSGFTLIELMLVIGIIAILSSVVIAALSPTRQLGSSRDAKRQSDTNTILNAVYQYTIDHEGRMPGGLVKGAAALEICVVTAVSCNNGLNLRALTGSYLVAIPIDPKAPANGTGSAYFIRQESNGRLTVSAPLGENSSISTTR